MSIMDVQLNTWLMLDHVPSHYGDVEIVTQTSPSTVHRYTYAEMAARANSLMHALDDLALTEGGTVASLAWNTYYHLECYFAVPCTGRVLHTLNARLSPEDLAFIINDAEDEAILVAPDLLANLEAIASEIPRVKHVIVLGDSVPSDSPLPVICYETLIERYPQEYPQKFIPENTPAGLCYTSGTTGHPKGAQYTHRSTYLHAQGCASAAGMQIGPTDCVLPVVPMFHANAWGMVYAAISVGAKLVFAHSRLDPPSFVDFMRDEEVTITGGVPTVWIAIAEELSRRDVSLPHLREIICGGSQPPRPLIEKYRREFGLTMLQAWGMTETSPLASVARPKHYQRNLPPGELLDRVRSQAGIPLPGISISIRNEEGDSVPFDNETMGNLYVRGVWVVDSYYKGRGAESFSEDGWFQTGDVAIGNSDGYFVIADRTKDLIKSGGEWISSVEMEGALMGMDSVLEAVVVAIPDPKWQERPLACVVPKDGSTVTLDMVREHLAKSGFAKWQLPDRLEIIDSVPRTSVGKFDKKVLRSKFE